VANGKLERQFAHLLDAHGAALMAMLHRLCRNAHDAEDVFQDAAARIWRNLPRRPLLRNPRGWVMAIGYHAFVDARARRRCHEEIVDSPDDRSASPGTLAEMGEDGDRVQAAIAGLSESVREVVILHYVSDLSLSQTAEAMGISKGTVKSRLNAALNRLRSVLE
jgi:RNA polymerase sigma-70 factor (ECF subfamily)